jgi:hypothetical protein
MPLNVLALMDTSITETPVLVVLTNVLPVLPEKIVLLVLISELTTHLVNVQLDIMILVKLSVNSVTGLVSPVLPVTSVLNVTTLQLDLVQVVLVQKDGVMPLMVQLNVKKLITQKVSMI